MRLVRTVVHLALVILALPAAIIAGPIAVAVGIAAHAGDRR